MHSQLSNTLAFTQAGNSFNEISVLEIRPVANAGSLRAIAAIEVRGIVIKDCRIIQETGKSAWMSPPTRDWLDNTGQKRWTRIVELPKELRESVQAAVLASWMESGTNG